MVSTFHFYREVPITGGGALELVIRGKAVNSAHPGVWLLPSPALASPNRYLLAVLVVLLPLLGFCARLNLRGGFECCSRGLGMEGNDEA